MRKHVKDASHKAANAQGGNHVAQLRNGGIGQYPLDVVLGHSNRGRKESRESTNQGHHVQPPGTLNRLEEGQHASHQEDTSRYHGGRVDHGADGRGAFHSVRQPDVERELSALAHRTAEDEQRNGGQRGQREQPGYGNGALLKQLDLFRREHFVEVQRAGQAVKEGEAHEEQHVAHAGGQKSLLRGVRRRRLVEPEADQQVRTEAHDLPGDEEEQHVAANDQGQHARREEGNVGEEAREAWLFVGFSQVVVANTVDEDQQSDKGDHEEHDGGQRVHDHAHYEARPSRGHPDQFLNEGMLSQAGANALEENGPAQEPRETHSANGHSRTQALVGVEHQHDRQERQKRKNRNQWCQAEQCFHRHGLTTSANQFLPR